MPECNVEMKSQLDMRNSNLAMLQVVTRLEGSEGSPACMRPGGGRTVRPPQKFDLGGKMPYFGKFRAASVKQAPC